MIDYNKLYTFTKVAETLSVSAAARQLRRTQSAITQQIQLLEAELGFPLFERKLPRLALSTAGQQLYHVAKQALGHIDDALLKVRDDLQAIRGHIRLAALADGSTDFSPETSLCAFRAAYPTVDLSLREGSNHSIETMLAKDEIDFGIAVVFERPADFVRQEIAHASHGLFMASSYPASLGRPIRTYRDILDASLIDFSENFLCLSAWFRKNKPELLNSLLHRRPNLIFSRHASSRDAVLAGLGLAILPTHMVQDDLKKGRVERVLPSAKDLRVGLDLAYRREKPLRLAEKVFWDFLRQNHQHLPKA